MKFSDVSWLTAPFVVTSMNEDIGGKFVDLMVLETTHKVRKKTAKMRKSLKFSTSSTIVLDHK